VNRKTNFESGILISN